LISYQYEKDNKALLHNTLPERIVDHNELYLGLEEEIIKRDVSLLFDIEASEGIFDGMIQFYYESKEGLKRLRVTDGTSGLKHKGILSFVPPKDMIKTEVEKEEAYWIKIVEEQAPVDRNCGLRPLLKKVLSEASMVVEVEPEQAGVKSCIGVFGRNIDHRLVTAMDYEREVLCYSGQICQAKAVSDRLRNGEHVTGAVSVVVFTEDYQDGSFAFWEMRKRLKEHLLSKCEIGIDENKLAIVQPIYVKVGVNVWLKPSDTVENFELQQQVVQILENYLDPIHNVNLSIGKMISAGQIEMQLRMKLKDAGLERVMISAIYEDENGLHETDLNTLSGNPYVLVVNGEHNIYFL